MAEEVSIHFKATGVGATSGAFLAIKDELTGLAKAPIKATKESAKATSSLASQWGNLGNVITGVNAAMSLFDRTIGRVIRGLWGLAAAGGAEIGVAQAFRGLTEAAGESADVMLTKVRAALDGTVDDLTIMRNINFALQLGLPGTGEEMAELADSAQRLGRAVGRGPVMALQDLVIGIGRQSRMILDNLGLLVDTEKAYETYAKTLGKTVEDLTDAEKKQGFYNATMESAREKVKKIGEEQLTATDHLSRVTAAWANFKSAIAKMIATSPALTAFTDTIIGKLQEIAQWAETNQEAVTGFISDAINFLKDLTDVLLAAVIPALKVLMAVAKVAMTVITPLLKAAAWIVESIGAPGVGAVLGGVIGGLTGGPIGAALGAGAGLAAGLAGGGAAPIEAVVNVEPVINVAVQQTGIATKEAVDKAFDDAKEATFARLSEIDTVLESNAAKLDQEIKNRLYRR